MHFFLAMLPFMLIGERIADQHNNNRNNNYYNNNRNNNYNNNNRNINYNNNMNC